MAVNPYGITDAQLSQFLSQGETLDDLKRALNQGLRGGWEGIATYYSPTYPNITPTGSTTQVMQGPNGTQVPYTPTQPTSGGGQVATNYQSIDQIYNDIRANVLKTEEEVFRAIKSLPVMAGISDTKIATTVSNLIASASANVPWQGQTTMAQGMTTGGLPLAGGGATSPTSGLPTNYPGAATSGGTTGATGTTSSNLNLANSINAGGGVGNNPYGPQIPFNGDFGSLFQQGSNFPITVEDLYGGTGTRAIFGNWAQNAVPGANAAYQGFLNNLYQPVQSAYQLSTLLNPMQALQQAQQGGGFADFLNSLNVGGGGLGGVIPSMGALNQAANLISAGPMSVAGAGQLGANGQLSPSAANLQAAVIQSLSGNPVAQFGMFAQPLTAALPYRFRDDFSQLAGMAFNNILANQGADPNFQFLPYLQRQGWNLFG